MEVRVVRSAKRRKTITARLEQGTLVVMLPARMSQKQEQYWVERMRARFQVRAGSEPKTPSDTPLQRRATKLNRLYFQGKLSFTIEWVTNQKHRWGSCTPGSGSIRLSHELQSLPGFCLDYVIVHELAHLLEANHGPRFWELVHRYPHTQRAIGFLEGYHWARHGRAPVAGDLGSLARYEQLPLPLD